MTKLQRYSKIKLINEISDDLIVCLVVEIIIADSAVYRYFANSELIAFYSYKLFQLYASQYANRFACFIRIFFTYAIVVGIYA